MTNLRSRRLAVLASGQGGNLRALAGRALDPAFGGAIALVLTDRPDAGAVAVARAAGLPVESPATGPYRTRLSSDAERVWVARLRAHDVDTVLLAGFMRVLHAPFLDAFAGRVLNLHPSLLPAFPGLDAIGRAFRHGVRVTGCTVHLVTAGVDEGPILLQQEVPIEDHDTLATLAERVHAAEHALYPEAVHRFLTRPFTLADGRVRWSQGSLA
jgi:phosphoribosylglycinamide formyltransferase-1